MNTCSVVERSLQYAACVGRIFLLILLFILDMIQEASILRRVDRSIIGLMVGLLVFRVFTVVVIIHV